MPLADYKGKNVYYELYGQDKGNPLVLLNGIMMSTKSWAPHREALSRHNTLILMDFLDQGQSSKMEDAFTQEVQRQALYALLKGLGYDAYNLCGISYGGEVALGFALDYPQYVKRLLLFNTTAWTSPWLKAMGDGWNAVSGDALAYYNVTIPVIYSPAYYEKRADWMEGRKKTLETVFADEAFMGSMVRLTNSAVSYDVRGRLGEITIPTLIAASDSDHVTPLSEQRLLVEGIPSAHMVVMSNAGHGSMYEQPKLFASLVTGFISTDDTYAV